MKKIICGFCSLAIMVMCLSGCGKAAENDVTDDTSVSEQVTEDNSINIFNDEDSIFNGVYVDVGIDMYMRTDDDDVKKAEAYEVQFEKGEQRIIILMKGFSIYIINFEFELGEYNKQIIDTFLDSIEFISLDDF